MREFGAKLLRVHRHTPCSVFDGRHLACRKRPVNLCNALGFRDASLNYEVQNLKEGKRSCRVVVKIDLTGMNAFVSYDSECVQCLLQLSRDFLSSEQLANRIIEIAFC